MSFINIRRTLSASFVISVLSACTAPSGVEITPEKFPLPSNWSSHIPTTNNQMTAISNAWLKQAIDEDLQTFIKKALEHNYALQQSKLNLLQTKQRIIANGASFWPSVDLSFSTGTRKNSITEAHTDSSDIGLSARYELDVWGKLSDYEQQLNLEYAAQLATVRQQTNELVKNVALAWYQVVESRQQLLLSEKRLRNVEQNLAVIESGYESGINTALDVYLSRNQFATEQAKVTSQQTRLASSLRQLEFLLGDYPAGLVEVATNELPNFTLDMPLGIPSDVVKNNPRVQSQWMALMAQDAALAYSHKQRFPSVSFTASTGYASQELSDLLSNSLGWSLIGSISAPIFNAGRLSANEELARLRVKSTEQAYLETLHTVFSEIENGITRTKNLRLSMAANEQASESAALAEQISFEQYLKGLVSYTTVLDAQSRAFNAQSNLINLKYQTLASQLELYVNLGGDFAALLPANDKNQGGN
ncbi:MAG: efflux transporter outer membrane subunit [Gammaproteobacteria bacterium]|nr:efflux transporter outer membrane subunit [Gammaproteobacteria bacterium]